MPCNGYVPCQPEQLRPDLLAERMEGAMPCHNYKGDVLNEDFGHHNHNLFLQGTERLRRAAGEA